MKTRIPRIGVLTIVIVTVLLTIAALWKTNLDLENRITQNEYCITKLITAYDDLRKDKVTMTEEIDSNCPYIQLEK